MKKVLVSIVFFVLAITYVEPPFVASAATKSSGAYKVGFNFVAESNPHDLNNFGISNVFGAAGKPVLKKVNFWCENLHLQVQGGRPFASDWIKGCVKATMLTRLRYFE